MTSILSSRFTFAALVACIVLLTVNERSQILTGGGALSGSPQKKKGVRDLHEFVVNKQVATDSQARIAAGVRRINEAEEAATIRRSVDKDDGGGGAAGAPVEPTQSNVHLHIIAVGDSLTEGVYRAREATTKLAYSPYVDVTRTTLANASRMIGGDRIVSVSTQVFAFRGKSIGGIIYEAGKKMFASEDHRKNLIPLAIPSDLQRVFLNHQDADTGMEQVDRVIMVCSVLGGTNDLLRTRGSTVAPTLPAISVDDSVDHLLQLHSLCADYARAIAKRTLPPDSPLHVQVMMLPISLPPAMLDAKTAVHQRLVKSLEGKKNSIRATYGYCMTPEASVKAMQHHRTLLNEFITSPGRFIEELERIAQRMRMDDGGEALGAGDRAFALGMLGELHQGGGTRQKQQRSATPPLLSSPKKESKPIVTMVSKEAVSFDSLMFDDVSMWSDCLHPTPRGYWLMGERVGFAIRQQL